jgi:hypothetical protein
MGAIHHHAHAFEGQSARKRGFGIFNITAQRVFDAHRFANFRRGRANVFDAAVEDELLDLILDIIIQLVTIRPEKLDAIVPVGIVRRGNHDAGIRAQAARDVSHTRRRQWANKQDINAHGKDAR